jgi:hypothetical protein
MIALVPLMSNIIFIMFLISTIGQIISIVVPTPLINLINMKEGLVNKKKYPIVLTIDHSWSFLPENIVFYK